MRRPPLAAIVLAGSLSAVSTGPATSSVALAAEARPPDLRLEWSSGGHDPGAAEAVRGRRGETLRIPYRLRNVGGSDAFAVVVEAHTALGPVADRERLQPGPAAGAAIDRILSLALATGMRELCIDARLQTMEPEDAGDPNPQDNRICRKVEVEQQRGTARRLR